MHYTLLHFPEIKLQQSDGHKLRGYFAEAFGSDSDLYHNHDQDGRSIYRYPHIQFKVIDHHPMIIGVDEGARLIMKRFLDIKEIVISQSIYRLDQKNISSQEIELGIKVELYQYTFESPWMALNQSNHSKYMQGDHTVRKNLLTSILTGNILSFYKSVECIITDRILLTHDLRQITTNFKNTKMVAFKGSFVTNAILPDYIGLGKSVSRGYGAIRKTN